jgi:predicted Zn-dependent protease
MPNTSRACFLLVLLVVVGFTTSCVSSFSKQETIVSDAIAEGAVYLAEGKYGEAGNIYLAALDKVPNNPRLLYNLSLAQAQAKDFNLAVASINTLVRLFPENVKYLRAKAAILQASGASREACVVWELVLRLDPYDQLVRLLLAREYFSNLEFQLSKKHALELYGKGQYTRDLYLLLGRLQQAMGEGDGSSWNLLADAYFPQTSPAK